MENKYQTAEDVSLKDENARLRATVEAQENQISARDKRIAELLAAVGTLDAVIPVDSPGREGQTIIPGPIDGDTVCTACGKAAMPTGVDKFIVPND